MTGTEVRDRPPILDVWLLVRSAGGAVGSLIFLGAGPAHIAGKRNGEAIVSTLTARSAPRTIIGLLAALGLVAALTMPALASHVEPQPVNEGNPTCSDFDSSWSEVKVDPPANGEFGDGILTVTVSNYANNAFDWESNIGVDAVFVKAGNDKHNLYVYNPEATEDDGLTAQDGQGNGISHISFCFDPKA